MQITQTTARVIAAAGVNWLSVQNAVANGNNTPFHFDAELSIVGSGLMPYSIAAVYEPGHGGNTTGDRWELVVVGVIYEASDAAAAYTISIDWISIGGYFLWDPQKGDTQTLQFEKRNWRLIASLLNSATPIKTGNVALANGQQSFNIVGLPAQPLVSGKYVYRVVVSFENVTDAAPSVINYIVTNKQAAQCTVSLNPRTSNVNTIARYAVFAT